MPTGMPAGVGYAALMLTRSGVAKRLGKSLATVRRMEGAELHPTRGSNGVHLFDPDEVDAVARGETVDRSRRISDLVVRGHIEESDAQTGSDTESDRRIARLEAEISRQREEHATDMKRLRQEGLKRESREAAERDHVVHAAKAQAEEVVAAAVAVFVESLSDRDLAELGEDGLEELASLLDGSED